jgi:hypothetical protein
MYFFSATVAGVFGDPFGNMYLSCFQDKRIRIVSPFGIMSVLSGTGTATNPSTGYAGDGGSLASATFGAAMYYLYLDTTGNLFLADNGKV